MSRSYYSCPKCGESVCVYKNNRRDADYWAKRLEQEGVPCESCRNKEYDEEYASAKKIEEEMGLPSLVGTDKQIRWAGCLRVKLLPVITDAAQNFLGRDVSNAVLDYMRGIRRSSWWINARHCTIRETCERLIVDILTDIRRRSSVLSVDLPEKLREELLVRPEHPVNDLIAEVSVKEEQVIVRHPERDSIAHIMKANFFLWSPYEEWVLNIEKDITGSAQERAANVIADLGTAGFVVGCMDSECIQRATAGEYTPMYPRWIRVEAKGKLGFVWLDGDFRRQLDKEVPCVDFHLSAVGIESRATCGGTSRSSKYRNVSIPYSSVLAFAEKYGFRITPDAMRMIEVHRQRIEDAILLRNVPVERVKPQEKTESDGVPGELLDD